MLPFVEFGNVECRFDFAWVKCEPKPEKKQIQNIKMAKYCCCCVKWFQSRVPFILVFLLHHLHRAESRKKSIVYVCLSRKKQQWKKYTQHPIILSNNNNINWQLRIQERIFNSEAQFRQSRNARIQTEHTINVFFSLLFCRRANDSHTTIQTMNQDEHIKRVFSHICTTTTTTMMTMFVCSTVWSGFCFTLLNVCFIFFDHFQFYFSFALRSSHLSYFHLSLFFMYKFCTVHG